MLMWNMTTYKSKLKVSMLERETFLFRTESHILALKSSTNTKTIGSVGLVETNNFLRLILIFVLHVLQPKYCTVHETDYRFCSVL